MEEKKWTHEQWPAICKECGVRRILWPNNQSVYSLEDPQATFIHMGTGKSGCEIN